MNENETANSPPSPSYKISCTDVPQELLLKSAAKHYFAQFGRVQRLSIRPKSRVCTVEYATERGMQLALERAGEYNGQRFSATRAVSDKVARRKRERKEEDEDPDWTQDPGVQEELRAMEEEEEGVLQKDYELRSNDMQVDEIPTTTPKTLLPKQRLKKSLQMNVTAGAMKPKKIAKKPWESATASEKNLPVEQLELIRIIKQAATSVEEKYKILEARDKLIRLRTKKHTDLAKVKVTVGTCPDMCPEKERLMRETQHQISLYEQETTGKAMNPALAVKQYSRSSADQEVPLPHELRPVHVLRMTMAYLMREIMNLCDASFDVNFADWYHFLWDRTRGIRKDITQQELCSEAAVELVEQCARFHIHCSARLVGEDPSVFDQKINTENLTKCLQTLKYMYHDLELKGVRCGNEAEFRAYIILLNLNDGNFMWEVQQLRREIQKSKEVRFALQVYAALDANNYVRFFKLVHSTTYLNACLLLRYFVQVRLSALKTILKCFSPRQPHKSYPLAELTKILAFENIESTVDFLEYHGLMLTEDRLHVILDRRLFGMPEYPYAIDRAVRVIESKRACSVGEIVCGGRLTADLYENHVPQNSFDAMGRLNCAEMLAEFNVSLEDDLTDEADAVAPSAKLTIWENVDSSKLEKPAERSRSPFFVENRAAAAPSTVGVSATAPSTTTGMFAAASETIFGKEKNERSSTFERFKFVVPKKSAKLNLCAFQPQKTEPQKSATFSFAPKPVHHQSPIFAVPPPPPPPPKNDLPPPPPPTTTKPTLPPPPKPDLTRLLQQKLEEERRKAAALELQKKLEAEKKLLEERRRAEKQRLLDQQEKQRQRREAEERQRRELLEKQRLVEIKTAVTATVNHLLDCVVEQVKHEKLQEIAQKLRDRRAGRCFKLWREAVRMRRKKRKAVDYCFAWLMPRTAKEEARELQTSSQTLVLSDMKRYKSGKAMEIVIPHTPTVRKINLHEVCYTSLLLALSKMAVAFPKELFFKVAVSLDNKQKNVEEILSACIGWKNNNNGATFVLQQNKNVNQNITYCVEKQQNKRETDAHALLVIADDVSYDLRQRLLQTKIPFVLMLQNQRDATEIFEQQTCKILNGRFTAANLPQLIEEALKFLAQNLEKTPPLELDTLKSFLSLHFAGDIWKRIAGLAKWNSSYRDCLKSPQVAVQIYNDNLNKLSEVIFDGQRKEFADFPQVFSDCLRSELPEYLPCDYKYFPKFWKSAKYENALKNRLDTLYLSEYVNSWPPANENALESNLFAYCEKNFKTPEKTFYKVMSVVLKNIDPETNFDAISNFLWTDLMETIALEKIAEADFAFSDARSVFNQFFVVYNAEVLRKLVAGSWFYVNYAPIRSKIKELMVKNQAAGQAKRKRKSSERFSLELDVDLDEMLDKVTRKIVDNEERNAKMRKDVAEIKSLMGDLKESMEIQKKINSTFQKFALENIE